MESNNDSAQSSFSKFFNDKKKKLFLCFTLFFIIFFLLLSFYVVDSSPKSWDLLVSQELQEDQSEILDVMMKGFSWLGTVYVAAATVPAFALIFLLFDYKKEALFTFSCLLSGGVSYVLKILIDRPRPTTDFVRIVEETHHQSFPSGHVLFYTAFFGTLIIIALYSNILKLSLKIIISLVCLAMIVLGAVSRIYLGAHWFTDVIGGFIVGVLFVMVTGSIYLRSKKRSVLE